MSGQSVKLSLNNCICTAHVLSAGAVKKMLIQSQADKTGWRTDYKDWMMLIKVNFNT